MGDSQEKSKSCLKHFTDILEPRRDKSDFMFMTQPWSPVKAYAKGKSISSKELKSMVMRSTRIQVLLDAVSEKMKVPKETLVKHVDNILAEIGHKRVLPIIRWIGLCLCKILKYNYQGLFVEETSVLKVRNMMGPNPVVFAPTHRSYGDFILMSYLCYHYGMEIPAIAAGLDFKGMWLMGQLLRDCGAFFMRRSFGEDKLYKGVFNEYISQLVANGDSAIEFFIEGTRSRSGKSLYPKFGLLNMILEAYFLGKVPDVTFVPVTITYERVLEDKLFSFEMLGIPKPKESTAGLLKGLQSLEKYGKIHVQFGEQFSVKQFCREDPRSVILQVPQLGVASHRASDIRAISNEIGFNIIRKQQCNIVITTYNLLATSMIHYSLLQKDNVAFCKMVEDAKILRDALHILDVYVDMPDDIVQVNTAATDALRLHKIYKKGTDDDGTWRVHLEVDDSALNALQGGLLKKETYLKAFPIVRLQQYANPCVQAFVNLSVMTFLLHLDNSTPKDVLYRRFCFVRIYLQMEFPYHVNWNEELFDSALHGATCLGICEIVGTTVCLKSVNRLNYLLIGMLQPFLAGYYAAMNAFGSLAVPGPTEIFAKQAHPLIEQLFLDGTTPYGYVLSLDLINNALEMMKTSGALQRMKFLESPNIWVLEGDIFEKDMAICALFMPLKDLLEKEKVNSGNKSKL